MSGYRSGRRSKKESIETVTAHNLINWCSWNSAAKKEYLQSPCKDSYLIILNDGDKHLSCSCRSCHYSIRIKDFCRDQKRIKGMVSMMMSSNGKRLKELIPKY